MGGYLSKPITEKVSSDEVGKNVAFGTSSMQGWRFRQEDAHNCCIDFDKNVSLFAVYDGHGGHEVAAYCAQNLPDFIKKTDAYKKGDIERALTDAFLGFDATLTKPEVVNILKEIAGTAGADGEKEDLDESDEEENVSNLYMEAAMPLEEVMAKYRSEIKNAVIKNLKNDKNGRHVCSTSPYLRGRRGRERASCSSSGAGCSSSSSAWNTNEADVSSSSQPCVTVSSIATETKQQTECSDSSEAEQVLDSTTSNADVTNASPSVESTADVEPIKSSDMPDSSQDVKDKVSPSNVAHSEPGVNNDVEVNGDESKGDFRDADSSKGGGDNVSSSSCLPLENGEAEQQERISSSGFKRIQPVTLYQNLLCKATEDYDEDDDENDETFDEVPESDEDDDTEYIDDEDESDEDDNDDDEADNDNNYELTMAMTGEPGSDSGCTAVVAVLDGKELYVANAGDSRCVLCRSGLAFDLSLDHVPENQPEMERIVKAGGKVTADGRVNGGLNLSRAIGDHAYKQNMNLPPQEQMISALPDVRHITIDPAQDEFMVLACDGIWNFMSSQDVIQFVRTRLAKGYKNISQICEELFDHCLAPNALGDGIGCDNMTAVIVQFKSNPDVVVVSDTSVPTETKKRPISPSISTEENDSFAAEQIVADCKRSKTETV